MLADELDYVIGVDTHRDQHVLAVVVAPTGAVIAQTVGATNARGYADALALRRASTRRGARVWAVEGAGHYGAGFARYLSARGETVHRDRPDQPRRAAAARQGRPARRDPRGPLGAREPRR